MSLSPAFLLSFAAFAWRQARASASQGPLAGPPHALRQAKLTLEEWGSEFSPRKLGALERVPVGVFRTALCGGGWGPCAGTIWESAEQDKGKLMPQEAWGWGPRALLGEFLLG